MDGRILKDQVEHELTTRFRKSIWSPFLSAVQQYGMVCPGDRIAVCLSGGKDSLLMAKCMQMLRKFSKVPFELVFLSMDPGYSTENMALVLQAAGRLNIAPEVFRTDIYAIVDAAASSPCHICAAMRRGHLYKEAFVRGCNKIALGHHRDDAAETILLSILYGGQFRAMLPRLKSENYEGMQLVRPMYFVRERAVVNWLGSTGIQTITCACRVTRTNDGGKRARVKSLIAQLEKELPNVVDNIIASTSRVDLSSLLGYTVKERERETTFMEAFTEYAGKNGGIGKVDRLF